MTYEFAKVAVWTIRIFQLIFAIILMGTLSYIIDEIREFGRPWDVMPREVVTPEVFSILAIIFTSFGLAVIFFFGYYCQLAAAFLDFCIWVGYITSSGLLRHNFQTDGDRNPLEKTLNNLRRSHGARGHQSLNGHLVRLIAALVIIQIILYFTTTILSVFVARASRAMYSGEHQMSEKQSRFSFSRTSRASSDQPAVPSNVV